ncbi:MAG TPA: hypothetical protein VK196_08300 [Magnetospirillum sp.]|nr:hypothetical protein [Magnetospirillum sp.]
MATKTTQTAVSPSSDIDAAKAPVGTVTKVENAEEMRKRRAGIACFL